MAKKSSKKVEQVSTPAPVKAPETSVSTADVKKADVSVVAIDNDMINKEAYLISTQNNSYDTTVWFLAEATLILNKYPIAPTQDEIKEMAKSIAAKGIHIDGLNWQLAEKRLKLKALN